jgi:CRP-like cAMP-binding protein
MNGYVLEHPLCDWEHVMLNPRMNQCLAQLSEEEYQGLEPQLRLVSLTRGRVLYEPGDSMKRFLFPVTAKISIATCFDDENFTDIVLIGNWGMIGRRILIDGISSHRVHVSVTGFAYEIDASTMLHEFRRFAGVHDICIATVENLLSQISNEVMCSRFHSLEQRLAKWVLLRLDEADDTTVETTHQSIATSMGYKREAISLALSQFEGIEVSRGRIHVTDRGWMRRASCGCYVPPLVFDTQLNIWEK